MTRYFKTHFWQAAAVALAATVLLMAACGGSSKRASSQPPTGAAASGVDVGIAKSSDSSSNAYSETSTGSPPHAQSRDVAAAAAPSGVTGNTSGSGGPNPLPSSLDRKIVQTATLTVETDNVAGKFEDVRTVATAYGGFVASSTFGNSDKRQTAAITIRVPNDSYERALNDLRKLGDVKGEDSGANDVTEEYTDLQSRLRNLQATEAQYVQFLLRAENIQDVLTVQDRLNATRAEIEQVQGRINLVEHQTDLATITVHLDPPVVAKVDKTKTGDSTPLDAAADSFRASLDVLLGAATVVMAVAAFSWWIVLLALVAVVAARRQFRGDRSTRTLPPPPPTPVA